MAALKRPQRVGNHLTQWRLIPVPTGKQLVGFAQRVQAGLEGLSRRSEEQQAALYQFTDSLFRATSAAVHPS